MIYRAPYNETVCELLEFEKERQKEAESLSKEIMTENFPNLGRDLDIQVHEANRAPHKFQSKIIFKTNYNKTVNIKDKKEY